MLMKFMKFFTKRMLTKPAQDFHHIRDRVARVHHQHLDMEVIHRNHLLTQKYQATVLANQYIWHRMDKRRNKHVHQNPRLFWTLRRDVLKVQTHVWFNVLKIINCLMVKQWREWFAVTVNGSWKNLTGLINSRVNVCWMIILFHFNQTQNKLSLHIFFSYLYASV